MPVNEDYKKAFEYRSMRWALCNEDFSDLTIRQVAEVFGVTYNAVCFAIKDIKTKTGFEVKLKRCPVSKRIIQVMFRGKEYDIRENGAVHKVMLEVGEYKNEIDPDEFFEKHGINRNSLRTALVRIKNACGVEIKMSKNGGEN